MTADIDSVEHSTQHRNRIKTLKIAVAVPVHDGNGITRLDPQFRQGVCESTDPLSEFGIGKAGLIAINDLLLGIVDNGSLQEVFDQ